MAKTIANTIEKHFLPLIYRFGKAAAKHRMSSQQEIVKVDPRYFRPSEVDTLLGDATKSRDILGWEPEIGFGELVTEMVAADYALAQPNGGVA